MSDARTGVLELTLGDTYIGSAYSPQVEVTDTTTGHEVAITYMSPEGIVTERFDVADGEQGPQGPAGFSPTVTITDTPTGHTVTITDEDGPHSYDVPNYAQEEQERQDAWDELSDEVTDAITAAESATSAASTAATSATSAATSATSAAQAATTAAASANTAASSADAAATAANAAASDASAAATSANAAATSASNAADDASDAADEARQIAEDIQEELDAKADTHGYYYPSLSVGRADALTGADETAQWATRVTAGSGATTVRSVHGATVVWNQLVDGMLEAASDGITTSYNASTGLFSITNDSRTSNYNSGSTRYGITHDKTIIGHKLIVVTDAPSGVVAAYASPEILPSNTVFTATQNEHIHLRVTSSYDFVTAHPVGSVTTFHMCIFDLTQMFGAGNEPSTVAEFEAMYPEPYYPYSAPTLKPVQIAGIASTDANGYALDSVEWAAYTLRAAGSVRDELTAGELVTRVGVRAYQAGDENDSDVVTDGTNTAYALATPTTTPISPALPMTYRVEQGGTESIIVPAGEVSAAPVLTVAEGESSANLVMDALACIAAPDGPVATSSHAINTYLTMGGKLYKVTSAIAVGETIAAGTNVTATTVMAELIARTA